MLKILSFFFPRLVTVAAVIAILLFLIIDLWSEWHKWTPLGGLVFFIIVTVVLSKNPRKVRLCSSLLTS